MDKMWAKAAIEEERRRVANEKSREEHEREKAAEAAFKAANQFNPLEKATKKWLETELWVVGGGLMTDYKISSRAQYEKLCGEYQTTLPKIEDLARYADEPLTDQPIEATETSGKEGSDVTASDDDTTTGCDKAAIRDDTADCGNEAEAADKMTDAADPLD